MVAGDENGSHGNKLLPDVGEVRLPRVPELELRDTKSERAKFKNNNKSPDIKWHNFSELRSTGKTVIPGTSFSYTVPSETPSHKSNSIYLHNI